MENFLKDVLTGLRAKQKYLPSKYFYDEKGSKIFQEIMGLEEYYLTNCEREILTNQSEDILANVMHSQLHFLEMGAGDGSKIIVLLKEAARKFRRVKYSPIDISPEILEVNQKKMNATLPQVEVEAVRGDYFEALSKLDNTLNMPKFLLFMGSNIGNIRKEDAPGFIKRLSDYLNKGDFLLLGVDLKKNPKLINLAYNDPKGVTKRFNLNLLERINRELGANFSIQHFDHYGTYEPLSGAALSFLVSQEQQVVNIGGQNIYFNKHETIHTEISQKYDLEELEDYAKKAGFQWCKHFLDSKKYFTLTLLKK
jgi:dimethylhistidine N-methyltransferase